MSYSDTWATDKSGNQFVFTVGMKRKLVEAGLPIEPEYLDQVADQQPRPVVREQDSSPRTDIEAPEVIQIDPETGKYLGKLKWYNPSRGYGFIARGGGEEIFFHKTSSVQDPANMNEGQWLLYDVEQRSKGPEATDVEAYEGDLV
jgi:CspA family cold shock protein